MRDLRHAGCRLVRFHVRTTAGTGAVRFHAGPHATRQNDQAPRIPGGPYSSGVSADAMSFLTPLYILGLAAVSLPILFHLIRRTPRGVQPFSSLMFVTPSPPRVTRRSRLDQILLLLLRAAGADPAGPGLRAPFLVNDSRRGAHRPRRPVGCRAGRHQCQHAARRTLAQRQRSNWGTCCVV